MLPPGSGSPHGRRDGPSCATAPARMPALPVAAVGSQDTGLRQGGRGAVPAFTGEVSATGFFTVKQSGVSGTASGERPLRLADSRRTQTPGVVGELHPHACWSSTGDAPPPWR